MKKVIIDPGFWGLFPEAQINIMTIKGFDNHDTPETHQQRAYLLAQAVKESAKFTAADPFRDNPVIAQWRDAYSQFKKRKGSRASIEALLKRAN